MTTKFQVGKTYFTRATGDSNMRIQITIESRTDKTLKVVDKFGDRKTLRVTVYRDVEQVKPEGSGSMSAIICADRELPADAPTTEQLEQQANEAAARRRALRTFLETWTPEDKPN